MRTAVRHGEVGRASVGSVRASIVLDSAAPLQGSTGIHEGVTVNGERPGARRLHDRRGSTTESASELLHIGTIGGTGLPGSLGYGSLDFCSRDIGDKEILGDDAAYGVVGIVARVAFASVVGSL